MVRPGACQTFAQWAGPLASCQQETVDQALIGNGSRAAAAPDNVDPSIPLPRPLSPASGPSGGPCSCSASLPGSSSSSGTAPTPRAHPADTPADVHHSPPLAPPSVSSAPPARFPPHQTRSPLLCFCIGWSQHLGGLAASPTWSSFKFRGQDHFCDIFAHRL